ncbi:MAG: M55 family metallopeptidase [Theionarchaea archaeon]|nr:M55 family metallopeptidase [Theionarchaea archaeon]
MGDEVKVYVSVDFEGGACIVGQPEMTLTDSKQYEFARSVMTDEANAAARGAFDGGATYLVVDDAHGSGLNLLYDRLDERVEVLAGVPRPRRFPSLDESYSGMLLIGYHAMAGIEGGVLSHTYSSRAVQNLWLNGTRIGEIGMDAALAGTLGVPVLMVSSCEAGTMEAEGFLPGTITYATKRGYSRNCALGKVPSVACRGIEEAARRAVGLRDEIKPYVVDPPYELRREFKFESSADRTRPPWTKVDPRTVCGRSDDLFELM